MKRDGRHTQKSTIHKFTQMRKPMKWYKTGNAVSFWPSADPGMICLPPPPRRHVNRRRANRMILTDLPLPPHNKLTIAPAQ